MKKYVKWILAVLLAVAAGAGAYYTYTAPLAVEAVTLRAERAEVYFTAQGINSYSRIYYLTPLVSGRIDRLDFSEGDVIEPGQTLMQISASDYAYQIRQLESSIPAYEAQKQELLAAEQRRKQELSDNLDAMAGQIKAIRGQRYTNRYDGITLETNIDAARILVSNNKDLVQDSQMAYDSALLAWQASPTADTKAALDLAHEKLVEAERDYRTSLTDLDRIQKGDTISDIYFEGLLDQAYAQEAAMRARIQEDYSGPMLDYYNAQIDVIRSQISQLQSDAGKCTLTSPVGGVIVSLPSADTNLAVSGQPAAEIGIGSAVEVYVPLREISRVSLGQSVTLILENTGGDIYYSGYVTAIDDKAQLQISALGVEERRVKVTVDTDAPLGMGYAVDAKFVSYEKQDAIVLPKTALFEDESGRDCVFAVRDGVLVKLEIVKGMDTRAGTVIESGLAPGDVVIKDANTSGLVEGKAVTY